MFAPLFVYSYLTAAVTNVLQKPRDERGASFTEYVVLLAVVVAAVVGLFALLSTTLNTKIGSINGQIAGA